MKRVFQLVILMIFVLGSMLAYIPGQTTGYAQDGSSEETPAEKAQQIFNSMTPRERIGQLFLVSFEGTDPNADSKIYDLILNYHIGGVVLMAENNNFVGPNNTVESAFELVASLQEIEWLSANPENLDPLPPTFVSSNYIPLLIAISQEGDGYPNDQILNGLTPLPSLMAIGATWSPALSRRIGEVLGKELSALGINMFLGPSLDVLDMGYSEGKEALRARSFGSSPYWVGKLGGAYIEGIHAGSEDQILVIAKHFPGQGSADRDPALEVATVRKPLDLLFGNDLAPFFAVTGNDENTQSVTDGLLTTHIRYEGLQGAIRNTTRPLGFDVAAIEQLFAIPELSDWRQQGGILVSDNLGSEAIRRFYDPNSIAFDARQVARNAINAGIDLLYLDDFVATGDYDQHTTITRTLDFFHQKYMEDEAFAQRVNSSVLKILEKKYSIYPEFSLEAVQRQEEGLEDINKANNITFEVAQKSITLLHPNHDDYANVLPNPPGLTDRTVFFTELSMYRQCSRCPDTEMISSDALRRSILRLYGPQAGGDIAQYLLSTFSFNDLVSMLSGQEEAAVVEEELRAASWVVFAFMETDPGRSSSLAFKRLLAERPELLANKNTVAFAFNSPHFLDATEISKLTAYYAVYSKIPTFTDVAARVLFQEIIPSGNLPISLPAVGYNLDIATSPNPGQYIPLMLDTAAMQNQPNMLETEVVADTAEPASAPSFKTGDTLPLVTGIVIDNNNNPVPDGTLVRFIFTMEGESNFVQTVESSTTNGIARAEFLIQNEGRLLINVTSGKAVNSDKLALNITEGEAAVITVIIPTATPTETPSPTATVATGTPSPTVTPTAVPIEPKQTSGSDWILSMMIIWSVSGGIFLLARTRVQMRWALRWGLLTSIGGLIAYVFLSLNLNMSRYFLDSGSFAGIFIALLIGMTVGLVSGWVWYRVLQNRARNKITTDAAS